MRLLPSLPTELLPKIFEQLEPNELRSFEQVSRTAKSFCDEKMWRRAAARQIGCSPAELLAAPAVQVQQRSIEGKQLMRALALGWANEVKRSVHAAPSTGEEMFVHAVADAFVRGYDKALYAAAFTPRISTEEALEWPHTRRARRFNRLLGGFMAASLAAVAIGVCTLGGESKRKAAPLLWLVAATLVVVVVSEEQEAQRVMQADNVRRDRAVAAAIHARASED